MKISLIAALAENNVIGANNQLLWQMPADLLHFKQLTMGKSIIMGRKTFESIGRALPGRKNIIITRNVDYVHPGVTCVASLEQALEQVESDEAMIIGGEMIYRLSLPIANCMYLTKVACQCDGDAFFPEWDPNKWQVVSTEKHTADENNPFDYEFMELIALSNH